MTAATPAWTSERAATHEDVDRIEATWLMRIGAVGAVAGGLLAGIGNAIHPITPRGDAGGVAHVIAHSDAWTAIHLAIVVGLLGMLAGLIGLRQALPTSGFAGAMTRYGLTAGVIGTVLGIVTVILDGVGAKQLANAWAAAPADAQPMALQIVTANETVNFALAGAFNATYAGLTFIAYGLAVARSDAFPRWLGWIAVVAGTFSVLAGGFQALSGQPSTTSLVLTIVGPTVIVVWMMTIGVLMGRAATRR